MPRAQGSRDMPIGIVPLELRGAEPLGQRNGRTADPSSGLGGSVGSGSLLDFVWPQRWRGLGFTITDARRRPTSDAGAPSGNGFHAAG